LNSTINIELFPKQIECFAYLEDKVTTEVLFGGGAGGSKTFTGCLWQIQRRLTYAGTRSVIGRSKLKNLKATTLNTFFEVAQDFCGLKPNEHFTYNAQDSTITFFNDSIIYLKDLFLYPSDPDFTSLGGLEITDAFVDECAEVTQKAVNILNSRIRFKLDKYNLIPKTLMTCNPTKTWLYSEFYKPYKEDRMQDHRKFIQSLVRDNTEISEHYIKQLEKLDKVSRQRLLLGDWEYNEDDALLFDYDSIHDMFTNKLEGGLKYITCDVARFGSDKTIIILWNGLTAEKIVSMSKSAVTDTIQQIKKMSAQNGVQRSHIIVDEDGVGGGVKDGISGCKGFVNGSKALKNENFQNLKTQCFFKLAELVNEGKVAVKDKTHKQTIIEELEVIKRDKIDKDTQKLSIIPKDTIKTLLGRSPDIADALMMRMWYEVKGNYGVYAF
jgi:PBSX family phage terminase large subunit